MISYRLMRWRARQRRRVWEALWMYGPFSRIEARHVARRINYSALRAARMVRRHGVRQSTA